MSLKRNYLGEGNYLINKGLGDKRYDNIMIKYVGKV